MMDRWATLAAVALLVGLVVKAILAARRPIPLPPPAVMPAGAVCASCDRGTQVTTHGLCVVCGSASVVMPWGHGAMLTLREQGKDDRKRFLRGGTPERRRA